MTRRRRFASSAPAPPVSRSFDGINDVVSFLPGNVAALDGGPISLAFVYKATQAWAGGFIWTENAGGQRVWSVNPFSDGRLYLDLGGGGFQSTPYTSAAWYQTVFTKANGIAVPNVYTYPYDTPGWTDAAMGGALGDSVLGPIAEIKIGQYEPADFYKGLFAAVGVWGVQLTAGQVHTMNTGTAAWLALSPAGAWQFNQAATTDPVLDVTGGGADQTVLVGTTVVADQPTGWSYS